MRLYQRIGRHRGKGRISIEIYSECRSSDDDQAIVVKKEHRLCVSFYRAQKNRSDNQNGFFVMV